MLNDFRQDVNSPVQHRGASVITNGALRQYENDSRVDLTLPVEVDDPAKLEKFLMSAGLSDNANAECIIRLYPNQFLYCPAYGWMRYTNGYWTGDGAEAELDKAVVETLRRRMAATSTSANYDDPIGSAVRRFCVANRGKVEGAKALLIHKVSALVSEFDTHKELLNVANGVVNLRNGELMPHSPHYRFMHVTAASYNPDADSRAWVKFLKESLEHEGDIDWLQEFCGYAITGHTREDCLLHVWGPSRSGKGTFAGAISAALGNRLAMGLQFSVLTAPHDRDSQNFALAPIQPARIVVASEKDDGQRLNSSKVKTITGGDKVRCSFKGRDQFDYTPQWKIIMLTNSEIDADPADTALWARIHSIKFPKSHVGKEDRKLRDGWQEPKSQEAILSWMVAGAGRWLDREGAGLPALPSSLQYKADRRKELDSVAKWLEERTVANSDVVTLSALVYQDYVSWCKDNGHAPKFSNSFGLAMKERSFESQVKWIAGGSKRVYVGIGLLATL